MKPFATLHRLKRRVRVLTAQKRRLVWELRAATTRHHEQQPNVQGAKEAA